MKVSYNVEGLRKMTDDQLCSLFGESTTPNLAQVYAAIGKKQVYKVQKKGVKKK